MRSLPRPVSCNQRGFTIVELMIAMVLALFLLGALVTVTQSNRRAFGNQNQQSQLQDSERTAMTIMTDVIQAAGYYPNPFGPGGNTPTSVFPVAAPYTAAGQVIAGAAGDSIHVRYMTSGADNVISCSGASNPGAPVVWDNEFSIINNQLVCTLNGVNYPLVNGVSSLTILFGVKRNAAATGNNVDSYVAPKNMQPADWANVLSVQIQLTFLYTPGKDSFEVGNAANTNVSFTRTVDIMSVGGVDIT